MRVSGDVVVERHDEERREVWVTSSLPARRDEMLTLDVSGKGRTMKVRVVESRPVLVEGAVKHELKLAILE